MLDLSVFDSRRLKILSWVSRHLWLAGIVCLVPVATSIYFKIAPTLVIMAVIFLLAYLWLFGSSWLPGNAFGFRNHLDKFFMKHATDYVFMRNQYQSVQRSAFMKQEDFVWSITVNGAEVPIMFSEDGGCIAWLQLERSFPHVVVDALDDNHWFRKQVVKKNLPANKIQLEGDFPDYFHVYTEPGQQVMTLQILAPDRMQYLVDNLRNFNLEIQDTYLRLFAANAQKSSKDFQTLINVLASLGTGMKLSGMNVIRD